MYEFLMKTYTIALPIALGYIVWLLQQQNTQKKLDDKKLEEQQKAEQIKKDAERVGTMLTLRYFLKRYHAEYMWQGYITEDQFTDFKDFHDAYHALGGNSVEEKWWNDIQKLPLKEDESGLTPHAKAYFNAIKKGEQQ